jgi:DNA-binding SARP family transcriptional activator
MPRLRVRLLGSFVVSHDEKVLSLQPAQARLLALLALNLGRGLPRDRAAGLLWPDLPEARARANLSTVFWRLRTALGLAASLTDILVSTDREIRLSRDGVDCDVDQFARNALAPSVRDGSLEGLSRAVNAVDSYRGDLLEDWDVEYFADERRHLRERYLEALKAISEGFEHRGRLDLALRYLKRAVATDPFDEALQRRLIRLYADLGERSSAVSQFNKFARMAREELGVEPDEETVSLVEEVKKRTICLRSRRRLPSPETLVRPDRVPLVGRQGERQLIMEALEEGFKGRGSSILLIGEPGIGKSRVADWALEEWVARGGAIARGRCVEFNEPIPYQPLLDALARFVSLDDMETFAHRSAGVLLDDLGTAGEEPSSVVTRGHLELSNKMRLFAWLRDRLEEMSGDHPLLLVVEDTHWADIATLDFLTYLSEHCSRLRVVLLVTSRPVARGATRAALDRLVRYVTQVRTMEPLDEDDAGKLARLLLDTAEAPDDILRQIYSETEGNPLFIIETLRFLLRRREQLGPRETANRSAEGTEEGNLMPQTVRSLVEQRLALLTADALEVAGIASVVGRSVDPELLSLVARLSENRLSKAIVELLAHGILDRDGVTLRFSHDKIRAVCYERLPVGVRKRFHARCAAALVGERDGSTHRLAWHQQSAGQWNVAAHSWRDAGDRALEVHAYAEAAKAYENAVSCLRRERGRSADAEVEFHFEILVRHAHVLALLGKSGERIRLLADMGLLCERYPTRTSWAEWFVQRAMLEDHRGRHSLAVVLARRAWSIASLDGWREQEIRALRVLAWALNRAGRPRRSLMVSGVVLRKIGPAPSAERARVLAEAASAHVKLHDYTMALAWIQAAKRCLAELGRGKEPSVSLAEAMCKRWIGDTEGARRCALEAARISREVGSRSLEGRALFQLAAVESLEGQLGRALGTLRRSRILLRSSADLRMFAACLNEVAYGIGRQIGNYYWAHGAAELALATQEEGSYTMAAYLDSLAQLLADQGHYHAAQVRVNEVVRLLERSLRFTTQHLESLGRRGAILLQLGEVGHANADLSIAATEQRSRGDRLLLPNTLTYLALTYAELGDAEQAIATSEEAVRVLTDVHFANHQPQRIFWHHYLLLTRFGREPRLPALRRAVELVEAQAATLSRAQQRRFRHDVQLNRDILEAWNALQAPASMEQPRARNAAHTTAAAIPA